jgi:hypothetical protein
MISLIRKLTHVEKQLIFSRLAFGQIYKLHGYGQYKIYNIIINVPSNIDQTQVMLPCLPYDEALIGVFLK